MSATTSAAILLAVMVAAFVAAKLFKLSTELSLFAAALAGALAGGEGVPARMIVEGAFTYFDIVLIFVTATLFMNLLKESGAAAFVVRAILRRFHRHKGPLFVLLALLLLVPGALTGAGSVTVLIMGGMAATVLGTMDIPRPKISAIIFVIAGLSAAAPPVNIWAMLTAAGVNMPYVGFFLPLLVPCVLLALATIFILGAGSKPVDLAKALAELPEAPARMNWLRVAAPFVVFFLLVVAGRAFPFSMPVLGLPLMFAAAAAAALLLSPVKIAFFKTSVDTVHQLLPLIGTLTCAGILVEIMALTGVRGLIAITDGHPARDGRLPDARRHAAGVRGRADVGRGARPGRAARALLQYDRAQPGRRPGRDERHLAARRRHPADGHHRTADGLDGGHERALRPVPPLLPRSGGPHRGRRHAHGRLQQEALLPDGVLR